MIDPTRKSWNDIPRYRTLLAILLGEKAVREEIRKVEIIPDPNNSIPTQEIDMTKEVDRAILQH